ncbi:pseudouridine synthase [Amylocarpus encephaloides]|uniref:Pseudouridine synthase n=1 Tax=Amylocarpus encephaloides TaxID=45428 RepID=A0A9P7YC90_9HELO|nr:pseudouridine synthase [Amylocarpus encephaloides]
MKLSPSPLYRVGKDEWTKIQNTRFHVTTGAHWRKPKQSINERGAKERFLKSKDEMAEKVDYSAWSNERLIARVSQLESELKSKNESLVIQQAPEKKSWKKPRTERVFDPSKYNTRHVAFKLAYLGKKYNGFEHHTGHGKPLPTIEEELWKALNKARLIFPKGTHPLQPGEVNWEGTDYSKCGRTDKGVSAFGQVISLRVRSNRPLAKRKEVPTSTNEADNDGLDMTGDVDMFNTLPRKNGIELGSPALAPSRQSPNRQRPSSLLIDDPDFAESLDFDPVADDLPYCSLLNRLLPPEIRILAWSPYPPVDFSARFSCRERRYKYFFTNPCFSPMPHNLDPECDGSSNKKMKDGYLDLEAMREAAKLFEGTHDFRNFCKVDPAKQITNFERRMFYTEIKEEDDGNPSLRWTSSGDFLGPGRAQTPYKTLSFNLHGSAFLWHQVRCMVAVLFLVGQGLEPPSIVSELLDVENNPCRPIYEMADDAPLVLWDCIFPKEGDADRKDAMHWVYVGDEAQKGDDKYGPSGLMDTVWGLWREKKIDEALAGTLLGLVQSQGSNPGEMTSKKNPSRSQRVFGGDNGPRLQGNYLPVMQKVRQDPVEVQNERYAQRKGFESSAEMKILGFRRMNIPVAQEAPETDVAAQATVSS